MRFKIPVLSLLITLCLVIGGCGYYFPHIYDGPTKKVYLKNWGNKTNKLNLDSKIYQSLSAWFQKSKAIVTTKEKSGADLILTGEIVSIDLPSISWDGDSRATEVKVKLTVRYIVKDLKSEKILLEVSREHWTEEFSAAGDAAALADNENVALDQIIDDLSERIYLNTLDQMRKINLKK